MYKTFAEELKNKAIPYPENFKNYKRRPLKKNKRNKEEIIILIITNNVEVLWILKNYVLGYEKRNYSSSKHIL